MTEKVESKKVEVKVEDMKTSELIDEFMEVQEDDRWAELDDELDTRYPICTILETIESLEEEIKELKRLKQHQHSMEGKVLYEN